MSDYRLEHPDRGTLEFRQAQRGEDQREAVADVTAERGVDRPPLVHVRARTRERTLTGRVTAPRRAREDGDTDDWLQALANYVVRLEAFCDDQQGAGYTFVDDQQDEQTPVVLHEVEWTLAASQPYEIEFSVSMATGEGVLASRPLDDRTADPQTGMDVAARVEGVDLPGFRELRVTRSFDTETDALFGRGSAANNQVVAESGVEHRVEFSGTHTGTESERRQADAALEALIGAGLVEFQTRFPGYALEGKVLAYRPERQAGFGTDRHDYELTFVEAVEG